MADDKKVEKTLTLGPATAPAAFGEVKPGKVVIDVPDGAARPEAPSDRATSRELQEYERAMRPFQDAAAAVAAFAARCPGLKASAVRRVTQHQDGAYTVEFWHGFLATAA